MSLLQRVTSIEGTDREQPQLGTLFNGHLTSGYGTLRPSPYLRHEGSQRRSLRHVLSYNAFADPDEGTQAANPSGGVTQYKTSNHRRCGKHVTRCEDQSWCEYANIESAQVVFTVLSCWLASGIVFGFAALKPVLISEGVYRELCTVGELQANVKVCYEQDLRYIVCVTRELNAE